MDSENPNEAREQLGKREGIKRNVDAHVGLWVQGTTESLDASLTVLLVMAIGSGLYMAWAIGANDVANSMGTSVGAGALTVGGAILIAGVFEFLGAFLAGGEVTSTIRKGIIDAESIEHDPDLLVIGMLSALLAAAAWLTIASRFGWPVSTTHSIVGAIIGFAVVAVGFEAVHWWDVATIAASWVVTPLRQLRRHPVARLRAHFDRVPVAGLVHRHNPNRVRSPVGQPGNRVPPTDAVSTSPTFAVPDISGSPVGAVLPAAGVSLVTDSPEKEATALPAVSFSGAASESVGTV